MPSILQKTLSAILSPLVKSAVMLLDRGRLPPIEGELAIDGLQKPVQVLRDRWYVPHIYAQSTSDAVIAMGYVHAQERLWQMDFNRRVVAGRLAEILGEPALFPDRVMRTLGFTRVVEQEDKLVGDAMGRLADAYCSGVNAWIAQATRWRKLPVEFSLLSYQPEPWQRTDTLGFAKLMSWMLAGNWEAEFMRSQVIKRLGPEITAELELDVAGTWAAILDTAPPSLGASRAFSGPGPAGGVGSNNWVLHGARTTTGKPLLANDMHLVLSAPAIWFENHVVGGELDVSGISLPGTFPLITGHNRTLAWGFTDGMNDVQDLYEEHLRRAPDGRVEYEFKGEWLPAEVRQEEIRVKGKPNHVEEVVVTRHGPIINLLVEKDFPDTPPLAMLWTALEPETTFQALYDMNVAHDCAAFHQALSRFSGPGQNTVYADTQGNIGFTLTGRTPVRARGDGSVPVPGWTGEYEWIGTIPFEEMPHLDNPAKGYVVTANNPHARNNDDPLITRDYYEADRATRIVELIEQKDKIDIPAIQKMQYDQTTPSARALASHLGRLTGVDDDLKPWVGEFSAWDGHLSPDSPTASVYEATARKAIRLMVRAKLGDFGKHLQGQGVASELWSFHTWEWFIHLLDTPDSPWFNLGQGEQRDDLLKLALRQAVDELTRLKGKDPKQWAWGQIHRLTFRHILGAKKPLDRVFNLGSFPIGGDPNAIWAASAHLYELEASSMVGPTFRFIADLGDLNHCWGMLAPGQSGHPASPHYRDGIQAWFNGEYHPMLYERGEVERSTTTRLVLTPK